MSVVPAGSPAVYPSISAPATRSHGFIETSSENQRIHENAHRQPRRTGPLTDRQTPLRREGCHHGPRLQEEHQRPRESPAIKIIEVLANLGADVRAYDPYVPSLATKAGVFTSAGSVEEALSGAECAVFLVDHDVFRGVTAETVKGLMVSPVVVDGKNLFAGGEEIVYLGIGKRTY